MLCLNGKKDNNYSPWIRLAIDIWTDLIKGYSPIKYIKDSIIYHQDEEIKFVYIVKSGRARILVLDQDGGEKHVFIVEEGSVVGEMDSFLKRPSTTAAIAIVDMDIYKIPVEEFWERIFSNEDLNKKIMRLMAIKYNILLQEVSDVAFYESYTRVVRALYNLVNQYGIKTELGYKIDINFTHQDIAYLINTSRVNVSNIFRQLSNENIVRRKGRSTYICDIEKLKSKLY